MAASRLSLFFVAQLPKSFETDPQMHRLPEKYAGLFQFVGQFVLDGLPLLSEYSGSDRILMDFSQSSSHRSLTFKCSLLINESRYLAVHCSDLYVPPFCNNLQKASLRSYPS